MAEWPGALEVLVNPDPGFWRGRRVLVTGHGGFKGSWLSLWLLHLGADVHGVSLHPDPSHRLWCDLGLERLPPSSGSLRSSWFSISDAERLAAHVLAVQPQVVFHLAAQPLVRLSYAEPALTWGTNVLGTIHLLEALRRLASPCSLVAITTDKVYLNREWEHGYRETDPLGGHDPYSSSKAAAELALASWRSSFCGDAPHQRPDLAIASVRAGNVIGGGDWSADRILPDLIRALQQGQPMPLRSPSATRPWQHVLEPLAAYLLLAERLSGHPAPDHSAMDPHAYRTSFNIGPPLSSNQPVLRLVQEALRHWPAASPDLIQPAPSSGAALHEAGRLNLSSERAHHRLGWRPRWDFAATVAHTMAWYRRRCDLDLDGDALHQSVRDLCQQQIDAYLSAAPCN